MKTTRVFTFGDKTLPDIDETISVDRIKSIYSEEYPELVNATITGPVIENGTATYSFETKLKTLG